MAKLTPLSTLRRRRQQPSNRRVIALAARSLPRNAQRHLGGTIAKLKVQIDKTTREIDPRKERVA